MLKFTGITKSFHGQLILDHIDFTVAEGEVLTIVGPSGTGKTTLLRCLNLLEFPDEGYFEVEGEGLDCQKATEKEAAILRRKTAMVFQQFHLFKHLTVLENVMAGLQYVQKRSKEEARQIAFQEIDKVGLADWIDHYPYQLSGGQQQRIAIARAVALRPQLILLDEPTASLDPENAQEVLQLIRQVAKSGIAIVLTTHEMNFAQQVSDQTIFMDRGRIVEAGRTAEIFNNPQEQRTKQFIQGSELILSAV